jgi:hypothetical protein
MKKLLIVGLLILTSLSLNLSDLYGQSPQGSSRASMQETAVCIYPVAGMRLQPGKNAQYLEPIYYGQAVRILNDTAYVPSEARVYMRVESESGKVGWVHRYLFELNATQVAVVRDAQIYGSPGAVTTITTAEFEAGEMAAMTQFQEDWILLVGKRRDKKGWVKRSGGPEPISVDDEDIAIASLMDKALEEQDVRQRISALEAIQEQPAFSNSKLQAILMKRIEKEVALANDAANEASQAAGVANAANTGGGGNEFPSQPTYPGANQRISSSTVSAFPQPSSTPGRSEEAVYDSNTGQNYTKVTEKGEIYLVKGPENKENVFFAYHKNLPKGAKILVNVPDNPGFVELEVINKLSEKRPQVIGMTEACMKAIFGPEVKNPQAEVIYFIKR